MVELVIPFGLVRIGNLRTLETPWAPFVLVSLSALVSIICLSLGFGRPKPLPLHLKILRILFRLAVLVGLGFLIGMRKLSMI